MLLKLHFEEEKVLFLQLHPHYTAKSTLHEQFLANVKSADGYSNIKNALIISLAALNELCHLDNSFATSPMTTVNTTTPMADPKNPCEILSNTSSELTYGMKSDMKNAESLHTSSSSPTAILPTNS